MRMPEISASGTNFTCVTVAGIDVWFSYTTPIAFHVPGFARVVAQNVWSRTTGKHINSIPHDRAQRVSQDEFKRLWEQQTASAIRAMEEVA